MRVWDDCRGSGIIVAVIDDGVEYTHPDLAANYRSELDCDTRNLDADAFPGEASDRHGMAVFGVITAALNNGIGGAGVAPEAGLVSYRIGFGAKGTLEQILAAFELLTAVDVTNNSWGFDGYFGDNFLDPEFAPMGDALARRPTSRWRTPTATSIVCRPPACVSSLCTARGGGPTWRLSCSPGRSSKVGRSTSSTTAACSATSPTWTTSSKPCCG